MTAKVRERGARELPRCLAAAKFTNLQENCNRPRIKNTDQRTDFL